MYLFTGISLLIAFVTIAWSKKELGFYYGDGCANLAIMESIASDLDLDLRNQQDLCHGSWNGLLALGNRGEIYSVHEIGLPIISAPLYFFLKTPGVLFFHIGLAVVGLLLVLGMARQLSSTVPSILSVCLVGLSNPVSAYTFSFSNDLSGAIVLIGCTSFIFYKRYLYAGILWGLGLTIRFHMIVSFPVFIIALLFTASGPRLLSNDKAILKFLIGIVAGLPLFLLQNYYLFGNIYSSGYERTILDINAPNLFSPQTQWMELPSIDRFLNLFLSSSDGLFLTQPFLLPVWLFSLTTLHNRFIHVLVFVGVFTYALFYSCYPHQFSTIRYFLFFNFLTVIPLAIALERLLSKLRKTV